MNLRTRLFLTTLEARENPSVPTVDPIGGDVPPPVPPPVDPGQIAADIGAAIGAAVINVVSPPAPPAPFDVLTADNSIYKTPLVTFP